MKYVLSHVGGTLVSSDWPVGQSLARVLPVPACYLLDVLQDRLTKRVVDLSEEGSEGTSILVVETLPCPVFRNMSKMKSIVNDIRKRNRSAMVVIDEDGREMIEADASDVDGCEEDLKVMAFNVAK